MKLNHPKYQVTIILLLASLLGLTLFVGISNYKKVKSVLNDKNENTNFKNLIVSLKSLEGEVNKAENSVKTYGITGNTEYLSSYYNTVSNADSFMQELSASEQISAHEIEFLDSLINQKFQVLKRYIEAQQNTRVDDALNQVLSSIESKTKENESKSEKSFVQRLFKHDRNKKENRVEIEEIDEEIENIKAREQRLEQKSIALQLELIEQDKQVTADIDSLLSKIEFDGNSRLLVNSEKAIDGVEFLNQRTNQFFFSVALLVLLSTAIIARYINANSKVEKALLLAKQNAEDLADAKETFLSNMSHEIRTPIHAISGFVGQLSNSNINDKQAQQLEIVRNSTDHLLSLVNDILDYSKLSKGKVVLDSSNTNLLELLNSCVDIFAPQALQKGINISLKSTDSVPKYVKTDTQKLKQILINVIGNALKFTSEGSISINVDATSIENKRVNLILSIEDTGVGMSAKQQERIFKEFEQAEASTSTKFGGTGLGLSITKQLVDLFEGNISVKSELNKGTIFTIHLPVMLGESSDKSISKSEIKLEQRNLHVLIVDDEEYNRKLLEVILEKHGSKVFQAENGKEALLQLNNSKIDLILMDYRMPEMTGIEATRAIRKSNNPEISTIPIISLSAAASEANIDEYLTAGMNGYIIKPFTENALIEEMNRVLSERNSIKGPNNSISKNQEVTIDFKHLWEMSNNDRSFFVEMLQSFNSSLESGIKQLKEAYSTGNYQELKDHAHRLASPCNHLGAEPLYSYLKELEEISSEHSQERLKNLLDETECASKEIVKLVNIRIAEE